MRSQKRSSGNTDLSDRVKSIIESKGLTLHAISQKSAGIFGQASPYFLHHNFYYELNLGSFSPSLYQLFALSRISNYRLFDWLHVFGLDVEQIPRLEILLPTRRTVLLDSTLADPNAWVGWFRNKSDHMSVPAVAPLSQLLEPHIAVRHKQLLGTNRSKFLYAKIGRGDAFAFPDLLPGSIVRVDPAMVQVAQDIPSQRLFLLEHSKGICCGRLLRGHGPRITVISTHLPYAEIQLKLPREARILGAVDLEIRRLTPGEQPEVPADFAKRWTPEPLDRQSHTIDRFLSSARLKAGLSLREASDLTREIARLLDDDRYFVSASSLSNYEAGDLPRHFQKAISVCLCYAIDLRSFLEGFGLRLEEAGTDSIPDQFIPRSEPDAPDNNPHELQFDGFLRELVSQVGDVPLFLRHSVRDLSGLSSTTLRTVYWTGGIRNPFHPYLAKTLLIAVDRHKKLPVDSRSRPAWDRSFYLVLKRDGSYLVGPCGIENGALIMHPDTEHLELREGFRNHRDAEVVGQVSAIVRKL